MSNHNPSLGQKCPEPYGSGFDRSDAIVEEIHLTAAIQLTLNGISNHPFVVVADDRLDGQSILGRRFEGA
jgi:hypothetical protein